MDRSEYSDEAAWTASPYGEIYMALSLSLEPGAIALARGTDSAFYRAADSLRKRGDHDGLERLERISLRVELLRQMIRARDAEASASVRSSLTELTHEWFAAAPMPPCAHSIDQRSTSLQ
jgi:hypothetical protein